MRSILPSSLNPGQFTMMELSLTIPQIALGPRLALRKKGGVVRPVSPTYILVANTSMARHRICHEKDLCVGLLSRDSCINISSCRSA